MITKRLAGGLIAGSLAIGLAFGAAGSIIAKDATQSPGVAACVEHMADMASMMSGGSGMMSGGGGMVPGGMSPGASSMPGGMQQHHPNALRAPNR